VTETTTTPPVPLFQLAGNAVLVLGMQISRAETKSTGDIMTSSVRKEELSREKLLEILKAWDAGLVYKKDGTAVRLSDLPPLDPRVEQTIIDNDWCECASENHNFRMCGCPNAKLYSHPCFGDFSESYSWLCEQCVEVCGEGGTDHEVVED